MEKSKKYYSSKQENMIADFLKWHVVPGSGSRNCYPGDIESDEWLGECKTHTTKQPVKFVLKEWSKIREEAIAKMKFPVLFTDDGLQNADTTWCMFLPVVDADFARDYKLLNTKIDDISQTDNTIAIKNPSGIPENALISTKVYGRAVFIASLKVFRRLIGVIE